MKIYAKCANCRRKKFFIRKRWSNLPVVKIPVHTDPICSKCYKNLLKIK